MALGDYQKTTYVNGQAPACDEFHLNNNENKTAEMDTWALSHSADYVRQPGYINPTGGTSTAYTGGTNPALQAYVEGIGVTIVPHVDCGNNPTFNWDGKGAIALLKQDGTAYAAGEMLAGKPYPFKKVGTSFLAVSSGDVKLTGQSEISIEFAGTIAKYDPVSISFKSNSKLSNPGVMPAGASYCAEFDPTNTYLAVGHAGTPFITIYKRAGDVFTKLANPATLPLNTINGVSWSSDGIYLAVACTGGPYIIIYKRNGDTFTKLSDPATIPTGAGYSCRFSPDTTYLMVGHSASPYVTIYKRSGDTFTKLANPTNLPPGDVQGCRIDATNTYYVTAGSGSPYVTIYKRSADTFNKLANLSPGIGSTAYDIDFTADSNYLIIADFFTPYLYIYKRTADAFNLLNHLAAPPGFITRTVKTSPDNNFLSVGISDVRSLIMYRLNGDLVQQLDDISPQPSTVVVNGLAFSYDMQYLVAVTTDTPLLAIYKLVKTASKANNNPSALLGKVGAGYAKEAGVLGNTKKVIQIWG